MTTNEQGLYNGCWVGRAVGCQKPREWNVFHDKAAFEEPFDIAHSTYLGVCSDHLVAALRRDPTAVNYVRPFSAKEHS